MKKTVKILLVAIPVIISLYFLMDLKEFIWQKDYTYEFNHEREKLKIPILSKNWIPRFKNRMKFETQYWDNNIRDTVDPIYLNKEVIVEYGDICLEADQYINPKLKQRLEIDYYFQKSNKWKFLLFDIKKLEEYELSEKKASEILRLWKLNHPKINP
jgi:hypothetical protein